VSRSMRAVEGSLLVVDSTQGVEAQTLANVYHAIEADHEIVPVLNKIDLPASECDKVATQIEDVIGLDASEAIQVSAKTGVGIRETLEAIVQKLPAPAGDPDAPLKAMLVDSWYDSYLGVIVLVRIIDGQMKKNDKVRFMSNDTLHQIDRIGVFRPAMTNVDTLGPGEILRRNARGRKHRSTGLNRRSLWCSVGFSLWIPRNSKTCAMPSINWRSTTRPSRLRWKHQRPWALGFGVGSLGFSILR